MKLCLTAIVTTLAIFSSLSAEESKLVEIEFKELEFKVPRGEDFALEKHVPKEALDLHGKRVRIQGFMHPSVFMQHGIKTFVFVGDNQEMAFGPRPLTEVIVVDMADGSSASFSTKRMLVEGTLAVEAIAPEGRVLAVYRLRDAKVEHRTPVIGPAR